MEDKDGPSCQDQQACQYLSDITPVQKFAIQVPAIAGAYKGGRLI